MISGAPFTFPQETFCCLQWPHLPCQALRCKPCTPHVPKVPSTALSPRSSCSMAQKASQHLPAWWPTFLQIKHLSNGAISCLNMSWAKPLCEYPENKWLPAGTTAMPPLQSVPYGCLICFSSLLCLQSAHLLSFSPLPHGGQREMACVAQPKEISIPASLFHPIPSPQDIPKLTNPTCVCPASQHHNV